MTDITDIGAEPEPLPPRPAGRRGVRSVTHRPELYLERFRNPLDPPPPEGDVTKGLTAYGMDGNDRYGDCGVAGTDHGRMVKALVSLDADGNPVWQPGFAPWGTDGCLSRYFAYGIAQGEPGPEPDYGVDNTNWLTWCLAEDVAEKGADGDDLVAFMEIDVSSPGAADRIHAAMLEYDGVLVAVSLTDDAEQLFSAHQPWSLAGGEQPDPNEGHDIYLVKYGPSGDCFVTWGALQWATVDWDSACIMQAHVFLTRADAERTGVDFDTLVQTILGDGGQAVPDAEDEQPPAVEQPAEPPAPAPAEPPVEAPAGGIVAEVEHIAEDVIHAAEDVVHPSRIIRSFDGTPIDAATGRPAFLPVEDR